MTLKCDAKRTLDFADRDVALALLVLLRVEVVAGLARDDQITALASARQLVHKSHSVSAPFLLLATLVDFEDAVGELDSFDVLTLCERTASQLVARVSDSLLFLSRKRMSVWSPATRK